MNIIMTTYDGECIRPEVLAGITAQRPVLGLQIVTRPRNTPTKRSSEAQGRNALLPTIEGAMVVMMDSDVLLDVGDVERAQAHLSQRPDLDGVLVSCTQQRRADHKAIAFGVYRTESLRGVIFSEFVPGICLCECINHTLKLEYVPGLVFRSLREPDRMF